MQEAIAHLELQLNDPDLRVRAAALGELVRLAEGGAIALPPQADLANMHCHTFFSFNAWGLSPSALAWHARQRGLQLAGIVDFDVLDGVDEFLAACDAVGLRGSAGIETRLYLPEYAAREVNSPGEPGIAYHMGIGFTSGRVPADVAPILATLRDRAAARNREMVRRINAHLAPVTVEYDRDVVPLTPAGNATERHIVSAYLRAAADQADPAGFWAARLGMPRGEVAAALADAPRLQNLVRSRLMKRGGVGYVPPSPEAFPTAGELHRLVTACGALPCLAWLDGTSQGEANAEELIAFWVERGVVAVNIIPDRNWNIADPAQRRLKVARLHEFVRVAQAHALPLNVGTEMNAPGQKWVDDFDAPELAPLRQAFLDGAYFVYGHTALQRACGLGYGSAWAAAHLPGRAERVAFYAQVGRLLLPGRAGLAKLGRIEAGIEPRDVLARLRR